MVRKNHPEWLQSLIRGESPLLSSDEWKFLVEIRSEIIKKARSGLNDDRLRNFDDGNLKFKLSCMKDNFEKIVEYLRKCPKPRSYFIEHYQDWKFVRNMNIVELKVIADEVQKTTKKISIARLIGSTVSLIGGVVSLIDKDKKPLVDSLGLLLRATSVASSFCEVGLLRDKIQRAEKIIEDDRKFSKKLWSWLSDASFLDEALQEIRRIDVAEDFKLAAKHLARLFNEKRQRLPIEKHIMAILKSFDGIPPEAAEEVADVVGILAALYMICKRHALQFKLNMNFYDKIKCMGYTSRNLIRLLASAILVVRGNDENSKDNQNWESTINIALDGIDIAEVLQAMQSKNKMAKCILEAAEELQKERDLLDEINKSVMFNAH